MPVSAAQQLEGRCMAFFGIPMRSVELVIDLPAEPSPAQAGDDRTPSASTTNGETVP